MHHHRANEEAQNRSLASVNFLFDYMFMSYTIASNAGTSSYTKKAKSLYIYGRVWSTIWEIHVNKELNILNTDTDLAVESN